MEETLIIIAHKGLERKITEEECKKALPTDAPKNQIFIDFEVANSKLSDLYNLPYEQLALEQQRKFKQEVEPLLKKHPNSVIAYFGLAPIPLSFHLGYLFNSYSPKILLFHLHHEDKTWYQNTAPTKDFSFELNDLELPTKIEKGNGDVFIRIATSYRIEPQHTYEVVANPTNEFDISLKNPQPDSLFGKAQVDAIGDQFQKVISAYVSFLPDRSKIHLFISSSAGLPFLLGTKINPTVCPYVQTYQYGRDETPKYKEAILISKKTENVRVFSEEEKKAAKNLRVNWEKVLQEKIKPYIKNTFNGSTSWFQNVINNKKELEAELKGYWTTLPDLDKTSLANDSIDLEKITVKEGFSYNRADSKWAFDDNFLVSILNRFNKKSESTDINQAGRLFLFHEGLHYSGDGHNLIEEIADGIGRFPKVIEEADYQADVWAIFNEYCFSRIYESTKVEPNLKKFFLNTIETAVETMWSFVDNGSELDEIQIRSMNRFLNWYWQYIRIERLSGNGDLGEIIKILLDKPIIEFAGAEVFTINGLRTCYKLNSKPISNYEIAFFHENKVLRFSPVRILSIVEGFKELDGEKIKKGLRSFLATI